jgi:hypothetical protein
LSGGLNLPCVASKADSLFLSQTCRMLTIPGNKQYMHIKYWLGLYMREYFPDMADGPHAEIISHYFLHMKSLLVGGIVLGEIDVNNLKKTSAKSLYDGFTTSFLPQKIVYEYDIDWGVVWKKMQSPILEPKAREVIFMLVNNIVANRDARIVYPSDKGCGKASQQRLRERFPTRFVGTSA